MQTSQFLRLNLHDLSKGFITAIITAILKSIFDIITHHNQFPSGWDGQNGWRTIVLAGVAAGVAYLLKNLFTNSQDQFGKTESTNSTPS